MKKNFRHLGLLCLILSTSYLAKLSAQNPNAVITDLKVYSFFNTDVIADSLYYLPEDPPFGPVEFLEDTLDVFAENGSFELNYLPADSAIYVGIWLDLNENGLFEKEEQLYNGPAQAGNLNDQITFPIFDNSRRILVAISEKQEDLAEAQEIPKNDRLSSLQFIIRAGPPTLTMGSKKDTRDTSENYCILVPMEIFLGPGHPCISVSEWSIEYPVGNAAVVNADVTLNPGGAAFSVGTMLNANDYLAFDLDLAGYPINNGDPVNFILQYALCSNPAVIDTAIFTFTKTCTTGLGDIPENQWNEQLNLQLMPNPVWDRAQLKFELTKAGSVQLAIFDLSGRRVELLQNGFLPAGEHQLSYDVQPLPAGIYWLRLRTRQGFVSKKMVKVGMRD